MLLVVALGGLADAQVLCLDPSFAGGGITSVDVRQVANVGWTPQGLDLQPDGRIVVGGTGAEFDGGSFFVWRLTEDGESDLSFGSFGFVEIPLGLPRPEFETIRVQADGTLVLAGEGGDTSVTSVDASRAVIARVSSSGVVEQVLLPRFAPSPQIVNGQVALPDGRALFAGQGRTRGADYNLFVFALLRDGGLDTSFGDGGLTEVDFGGGDEFGAALVQDAQGRLLLNAVTYRSGQFDFGLARLNVLGGHDLNFGLARPGRVTTDFFGRDDSCDVVGVQPDGKPLCGGSVTLPDGGAATALVRYQTNGDRDSTFGTGGMVLKESPRASLRALTVHPNGTIAVAGGAPGLNGDLDMTIGFFDPSGNSIPLSSSESILRLDLHGDESAHQLRFDSRNRLLVFGETSVDGGQNDAVVARYIFCGSDGGTPDAGTPDAGTPDAGTPDAGTPDAGTPDAGTPDAGTPDAGTPDAGTPDAGTPDAGTLDAGTPDAGTPDAGTLDAGTPDAGTLDAGTLDAGALDAGITSDGGSSPSSRSLKVGCSCDASGGLVWLSVLLLAGLRRRRPPPS